MDVVTSARDEPGHPLCAGCALLPTTAENERLLAVADYLQDGPSIDYVQAETAAISQAYRRATRNGTRLPRGGTSDARVVEVGDRCGTCFRLDQAIDGSGKPCADTPPLSVYAAVRDKMLARVAGERTDRLVSSVRKLGGNHGNGALASDAPDVIQEGWIRVFRAFERYDPRREFGGFVGAHMKYALRDYLRKQGRRNRYAGEPVNRLTRPVPEASRPADDPARVVEARSELAAFDELSEQLFGMRAMRLGALLDEPDGNVQVARSAGKSVGTTRRLLGHLRHGGGKRARRSPRPESDDLTREDQK